MNIKENSDQHLVLVDTPWWPPVVGLIVAGFCFWIDPIQMTEYPWLDKSIVIIVGLIFLCVCTLAIRKIKIQFDRSTKTVTRITEPLLPLGHIHLFCSRSEARPIKPIIYAYLEKQRNANAKAKSRYSLALATGLIANDILLEGSSHIYSPELDKVRWLVGFNTGMMAKNANEISKAVNEWLGTKSPQNIE